MESVSVQHLYKSYNGEAAVKDLSFSVSPGEILGLIGPNGAGKSSTIKVVLDLMKPDSGEVELFGRPMCEATKNRIGYLPEEKGLYKDLTAMDCILYLSSLKGLDRATAKARADELLEETGMLDSKKKKIKHMSKGMGQMIQFIVGQGAEEGLAPCILRLLGCTQVELTTVFLRLDGNTERRQRAFELRPIHILSPAM